MEKFPQPLSHWEYLAGILTDYGFQNVKVEPCRGSYILTYHKSGRKCVCWSYRDAQDLVITARTV